MENKNKGNFWVRILIFIVVVVPFILIKGCENAEKVEKEQQQRNIEAGIEMDKARRRAEGLPETPTKEELLKVLNAGNSYKTSSNGSVDSTADIQSQNGVETKDR